ncbi:MAG: PilZ domain-containing protein [bacterium]|nr:PilZ domain-containing protein [bacterium]MDD5756201.1 PilZ domain-containing protein [bacterium]
MFKWLKKTKANRLKKYKEKRISPRLNTLVDVVYKLYDKEGNGIVTLAKDVSASGMKLLHQKKVHLDTLLDIKIDLPQKEGLVSALGKVVWYKRKGGIGVKFLMIRPNDEQKHYEYIEKNLPAEK